MNEPPIIPSPGQVFSTPFEFGCVAITEPNEDGGFLALDSDGVECQFHVSMVTGITIRIENDSQEPEKLPRSR